MIEDNIIKIVAFTIGFYGFVMLVSSTVNSYTQKVPVSLLVPTLVTGISFGVVFFW